MLCDVFLFVGVPTEVPVWSTSRSFRERDDLPPSQPSSSSVGRCHDQKSTYSSSVRAGVSVDRFMARDGDPGWKSFCCCSHLGCFSPAGVLTDLKCRV
jgi:hypothetical protein